VTKPSLDDRLLSWFWLAAAAVLGLFPLVPRFSQPLDRQLRVPATPLDNTDGERAQEWAFLDACARWIPRNGSFTVVAAEPRIEMAIFMMAVGHYPGTYPFPNRYYHHPTPAEGARAQFVLRYRLPDPDDPNLRLIARVPDGAIYERTTAP